MRKPLSHRIREEAGRRQRLKCLWMISFSPDSGRQSKELNLIIKADVQGQRGSGKTEPRLKLSTNEEVCKMHPRRRRRRHQRNPDVTLAATSNAIIIGFNVRPDATQKATAEREAWISVCTELFYQAIEDIEASKEGMLDPVFEEKVIGHAESAPDFQSIRSGQHCRF